MNVASPKNGIIATLAKAARTARIREITQVGEKLVVLCVYLKVPHSLEIQHKVGRLGADTEAEYHRMPRRLCKSTLVQQYNRVVHCSDFLLLGSDATVVWIDRDLAEDTKSKAPPAFKLNDLDESSFKDLASISRNLIQFIEPCPSHRVSLRFKPSPWLLQ